MLRLIATASVLVTVAVTGCSSDTADESVVGLRPFASSSAPFSTSVDVAMVSEEVACVIDSFESRIHCVDRRGRAAGVFGREGEAPGEFRGLTGIARGPDGLLGAVEFGSAQLTFFEPDGTLVSETRLPPGFQGDMLHGDRLFGFKLTMLDRERREDLPDYVPMEVDAFSGETLWERTDLADAVGLDCFTGVRGIPTPGGGLVFPACRYELAFLDHRDAPSATVVASPAYFESLPNERDVDAYVNAVAGIGRRALALSPAQKEAYAAEFREEPKDWFLTPVSFNFDAENRLWAATTRDRDAFSYFEVWTGTEYAGTVRIRDRLMGYDILGSTLAALVERTPDRNGFAPRAIDWYDISAIEFGRDEQGPSGS